MNLQSRNASDSSDHVVKFADHLVCGVHTGRKNLRGRNIVEIPDSRDKWEPGLNLSLNATAFQLTFEFYGKFWNFHKNVRCQEKDAQNFEWTFCRFQNC